MRCHGNEAIDGGSWMCEVISRLAGDMRLCEWENCMFASSCCEWILKLRILLYYLSIPNQKQ